MPRSDVGPGTRVSEYVLEQKIGEGGFGTVWRAVHHLWKDRVVAVKIPSDERVLQQLRHEGMIQHDLQKLNDEHIVRTLGIDTAADPPYFIMEYIEGGSLRDLLRDEGRLSVETVVDTALQILRALRHAHGKGVVHCDLKPENILVGKDGRVLLTDFGLGYRPDHEEVSLLLSQDLGEEEGKAVAGTLEYMAPEQRQGTRDNPSVDIYSFGVVLFEMITGERPQPGDLPGDLVPSTPKRFDEIFKKCFVRVERRFGSVDEIIPLLTEMARDPKDVTAPEAAADARGEPASAAPVAAASAPGPRKAARSGGAPEIPQGMVLIPAGKFTMGVDDSQSDAFPGHVRFLEDFFLDLIPVTNGRFFDFVKDGGYRKKKFWGEDGWPDIEKYTDSTGRPGPRYWIDGKYPSGLEPHPVVGVSYFEARAFCRWAGKKLPSEEEWEKASRGPGATRFPWGNTFERSLCNTREAGVGTTTPAGKFRKGKSAYGVLDMAGNVLEWTRSFYEPYPGNEQENPHFGELYRVLRGGAWYFKKTSAETTMRFIMRPNLRWNYVGFRCARDAT
jgi:formylglycine-generating enzyme required for sulfatase activity/predicted Ser/Thr protein kinase